MLTKKQQEVYDYIKSYVNATGMSPAIVEIQTALGYKSKTSVYGKLDVLERLQLIKRQFNQHRSITIL